MKTSIIALASIFLFAFSCEGDKKENKSTMEDELNQVIDEKVILADDYEGKLDELLTLELAAETSGYPAAEAKKQPDSEIEKKYNEGDKATKYDNLFRVNIVAGNYELALNQIDSVRSVYLKSNPTIAHAMGVQYEIYINTLKSKYGKLDFEKNYKEEFYKNYKK